MYNLLLGLFAVIFGLGIALCLIQFWLDFHKQREQIFWSRTLRNRRANTFHYDANGNPEIIRNPETLDLQIPPTGNSAFAPTILFRDSIQRNIKADPERPVLYNIPNDKKVSDGNKTIEQLEAEVIEPEISTRPKLPISEGEKRIYIENCLRGRVKITRAAKAIGIHPGDGKEYLAFKSLWSTVVASYDNSPLS